jgi:primosomal protein N' (replication factor Y)
MDRAMNREEVRHLSRLVEVAVPVPFVSPLIYRVPRGVDPPVAGVRVLVPLGARQVTGIVVSRAPRGQSAEGGTAPQALKELSDVLDGEPFLPEPVVRLALWTAEYYACSAGEALAAAMPPLAWVESDRLVRRRGPTIDAAGESGSQPRASARRALLLAIPDDRWVSVRALGAHVGADRSGRARGAPIRALVHALEQDGLVETTTVLKGRASAFRTASIIELTPAGRARPATTGEQAEGGAADPPGRRQREALEALRSSVEGIPINRLRDMGVSGATVARLRARGLVVVRRQPLERDPFAWLDGQPAGLRAADRSLTREQATALDRLVMLASDHSFHVALVHGVTGSGKTEIYLRLAGSVLGQGRRALVLVPEIALTPAVAAAFRSAFGTRVAIQHSGLSDGERHDEWQRIRSGAVDIVVGTRSAVFAPLPSLGLVIVDEEHDTSYKQEESPRYHGRDLAIVRARQADALVVLGSATPSLESYSNARAGRYELLTLERRVLDRPLASVQIVNMREVLAEQGPETVLSAALLEAVSVRLGRREQVLILLNRRGFATAVFCRQCGATLDCPNCSVSLTVHGGPTRTARARCHYCNYARAVPPACLQCAGPYLMHTGFGTERVEQEIRTVFPEARVARLDRDAARRRTEPAAVLRRFAAGDIDILVGTQMIAKGHDFPRVTLVGVVSADVGLGLADFRAGERTFQLLTQVVGRAGRGEQPGEAVIQTLFPEHYSIQHACRQDYTGFFADETRFRRAMRYPPAVGLINVIVRGRTLADALETAASLARLTRERLPARGEFEVLGPAPAPYVKLRGESRAQFFLKGPRRLQLRAALDTALAARPKIRRKVTVDVDPMSVL